VRKRLLLVCSVLAAGAIVAGQRANHWMNVNGLTTADLAEEMTREGPRYEWKSIDKTHWQAVATGAQEDTAETDRREKTGRGCPAGMVRIKGNFREEANGQSTGAVERLQDSACTDWISRDFPARCRTFDKDKVASLLSAVPIKEMDFCIDRFEYPNQFGQNPIIVVTFHEAQAMCRAASKRLCNENEWTFACEGEEARPYPYGYTRDEAACVIDKSWRPFTEGALQPRDSEKARTELDTLWQGEPSGSRPLCRSSFGVYDQTGNVDEWTESVNPTGFRSILKGGYWGPVRARCRPSTRAHNEDFIDYQQTFRCCGSASDATDEEPEDAGLPVVDAGDGGIDTDDEIAGIAEQRRRGCDTTGGGFDGGWLVILALFRRRRA
jgi:hypothetical protein